ncbi:unnamed protein product [Brassica rapa subsp. narinosa]
MHWAGQIKKLIYTENFIIVFEISSPLRNTKYENAPEPFRLSSPHQTSSTSRDTADPKTYTTATDQHGKENLAGLLNTTESFPLSPSENIDQTAKNEDILTSWDDDDDV